MIASYKYGFIFIRTKKTASTAVELGLSQICGPDDIISPIGAGQEILRASLGAYPRNFSNDNDLEKRFHAAVATKDRRKIRAVGGENRAKHGCTGHMTAASVKARVPAAFWESAYKFTTERHPYEKALSLAHMRYWGKNTKEFTFEEYLQKTVEEYYKVYTGYAAYTIDRKSVMDTFLLHETLADDIARLREKLKLPDFEVPRARATRTDRRKAADVLTDAQKEFIYSKCKFEFDLHGWKK